MSTYKTRKEIFQEMGITRRAIQGYEEMGLVSAIDKNKYGYMLYGEDEVKRIETIKLYQRLGFRLKEIQEFIDAPNSVIKQALERRVELLKEEQKRFEGLIKTAIALIEELNYKHVGG